MSSPPCGETPTMLEFQWSWISWAHPRPCWQQAPYTCTEVLVRCIVRCMSLHCCSTPLLHTGTGGKQCWAYNTCTTAAGARQPWFAFPPCKATANISVLDMIQGGDTAVGKGTNGFLSWKQREKVVLPWQIHSLQRGSGRSKTWSFMDLANEKTRTSLQVLASLCSPGGIHCPAALQLGIAMARVVSAVARRAGS